MQLLVLGYLFIISLGTVLLMLPFSRTEAISANFVNALFTATSAATTTGLVVHDTTGYSLFGQLLILGLIQVSGLGYMLVIVLMAVGTGRHLSLGNRMLLRESLGRPTSFDMLTFGKIILWYTFVIEVIAVAVIGTYLLQYYQPLEAYYQALFHVISAFCTAGFTVSVDSMMPFRHDAFINVAYIVVAILGGIGFFVLYDAAHFMPKFFREQRPRVLSVHSRFTILLTLLILVGGSLLIYALEQSRGTDEISYMTSLFQTVMASTTTGYNSVNIPDMATGSLFVLIALMFVGGSPGSTAGGIKTTTLGIMLFFVPSGLLGRNDINLFRRRIAPSQINRAFALTFIASIWVVLGTMFLSLMEDAPTFNLLFEAVSALSTGGLSVGTTPTLSDPSKLFITLSMLAGRVGTLGIGFALLGKPHAVKYKYAEADVLIG
jgi:trk system potassium uptake protein